MPAGRGDLRPINPVSLLDGRTTTGAGEWVTIGRALPSRIGVAVRTAAGTATVQLQGRIDSGSTFAISVGAATTMATTPRIVTLSTGLGAVAQVRARVTAISGATVHVKIAL